ncbi:MAG: hypothetical protein D6806_12820 [Deltaproteobacteria bacterium]|nr:MAG: hypothetical protein D6806_12820 [Deltaproteobacteria bacterium]
MGAPAKGNSDANVGFRFHFWKAADALHGSTDSADFVYTYGWTFHVLLATIKGSALSAVGGFLR